MRIISGKARGVRLESLEGLNTRPTTDRVKESLFNLIQFHIQDAHVIDFFSGSGALGIEAASRGATSVQLVEQERRCHKIIENNINRSKLDNIELVKSDVMSSMSRLKKADLIIMDPPYNKDLILPVLNGIEEYGLLEEEGIIVVEHSKDDVLEEKIGSFLLKKQKKYGITMISIFSYDV